MRLTSNAQSEIMRSGLRGGCVSTGVSSVAERPDKAAVPTSGPFSPRVLGRRLQYAVYLPESSQG